ncbi:FxLYD domain-containing protein [Sorangium sp. So ce131]|uniref:FxLYD domain-containing protein n=1 Tax=Sorangium sp. So ce131 TaxID=3133282 RepID=UPI003F6428B5
MQSKSLLVLGAVALVLPLACSGSTRDEGEGTGGNGPGSGGGTASGGSSGSGGVVLPSGGTTNSGGAGGGEAGAASSGSETSGSGVGGGSGEDLLFVPEGLSSAELDGEGGGLTLVAFTLVQGANGPELYAAVRNDGDTPACDAGMMVYFIDEAEQLVTSWGGSLRSGRLYQLNDGSGVIIPCVAPGEVAMAASTDLPDDLVIEELGALKHRFPAFTVDVVPVDAITVGAVETVSRGDRSAYTGTLENGLDVAVSDPEVAVFPVNRVGRPLGMATSRAAADVPPGGTWTFETTTVDDPGVDYVVYPTASIAP